MHEIIALAFRSEPVCLLALREFLDRIAAPVHAALHGFATTPWYGIDDMAQCCYIKVLREMPTFLYTTESRFMAWLQTTARNAAKDLIDESLAQRRDARRTRSLDADPSIVQTHFTSPNDDPLARLSDKDLLVRIEQILAELDAADAAIARQMLFGPATIAGTAKALRLNANHTSRRWARIQPRIALALGRAYRDGQRPAPADPHD